MTMTKLKNGVRITLTAQEEAARIAESDANQVITDARVATETAYNDQVDQDKADLPSWNQVQNVINNISNMDDAKSFLLKLSRVVYTMRKQSVD